MSSRNCLHVDARLSHRWARKDLNLEPTDFPRKPILLARLVLSCAMCDVFGWYSAANGPQTDPTFGMNPFSETKSLGTLAVFHGAFVASPSRRRGLGKRATIESSSPDTCGETLSWFSLFPLFTGSGLSSTTRYAAGKSPATTQSESSTPLWAGSM